MMESKKQIIEKYKKYENKIQGYLLNISYKLFDEINIQKEDKLHKCSFIVPNACITIILDTKTLGLESFTNESKKIIDSIIIHQANSFTDKEFSNLRFYAKYGYAFIIVIDVYFVLSGNEDKIHWFLEESPLNVYFDLMLNEIIIKEIENEYLCCFSKNQISTHSNCLFYKENKHEPQSKL